MMKKLIHIVLVTVICMNASSVLAFDFDSSDETLIGERITHEMKYVIGIEDWGFSESGEIGKQKFSLTCYFQNLSLETLDIETLGLVTAKLVYKDIYAFALEFEKYCHVTDPGITCDQYSLDPLMEILGVWSVDVPDAVSQAMKGQLTLIITLAGQEYIIRNRSGEKFNKQYRYEGPGYDTPEDAAIAYLYGLRDRDYLSMISTFAIESYIDNYDLNAFLARVKSYTLSFEVRIPTNDKESRELNILYRLSKVVDMMLMQYLYITIPTAYSEGGLRILQTEEEQKTFLETVNSEMAAYPFADLEILDVLQANQVDERYDMELNQKNIANQAMTFTREVKNVANLGVVFRADNHKWMFCPQLVSYNDCWYIASLQGNLAHLQGINYAGGGIFQID